MKKIISIALKFYVLTFVVALVPFYFLLRLVFYLWNMHSFQLTFSSFWDILWYSFQMDLASVTLSNLPVFFLLFVSMFLRSRVRLIIIKVAFALAIMLNAAGFVLNIIDIGYFPFNRERSTLGLLSVFGDSLSSIPSIFSIYWPLLVLFLVCVTGFIFLIRFFFRGRWISGERRFRKELLSWALTIPVLLIMVRGIHSGPLIPATPLLSVSSVNLPLVQNSIHNFLYSLVRSQMQLRKKAYFTQKQLTDLVACESNLEGKGRLMQKKNVVIFILESFSRDYLQDGNPYRAHTPFLDSLVKISSHYPNAFANGFTSNQGIVAILSGLPAFLDEPFYYSVYANTKMTAVGDIFKKEGYNTNFFMGAGEDHFGFGKYCRMTGIENYYSRKDFNDDSQYDGNWGIFDEPFLQFGIRKLNQERNPFFSVFFTLSSHPPFTIPGKYKDKLSDPDPSAAQRSISYVDFALARFFDASKDTPWFGNTLFIFCADHWLSPDENAGFSQVHSSAIPILIFDPADPVGKVDSTLMGQVDIIPTLLEKLNYSGVYTGFGRSMLNGSVKNRYVVNRLGGIHQVITDTMVLGYSEPLEKIQYIYNYSVDPRLENNLADDPLYAGEKAFLLKTMRANIQLYNNSLLKRDLFQR